MKFLETNKKLEEKGIIFIDINTVYIDEKVTIAKGTKIYPNVVIEGNTKIGENSVVGMCSHIVDSEIGDNVEIEHSVIKESTVGSGTKVGPFAYIRPGSDIGENCKIGDFVEVKNSTLGNNTKSSHLAYIGDSDLGNNINIGCGVIFVNYDGKNKYRSKVEDGAFIGCNSNLVSPVNIGEKAYIGAGSTITEDVPKKSLYVARSKGVVKNGWVDKTKLLDK